MGNAAHSTYFLTRAYGFTEVAYQGLETGARDRVSHVVQQGRVRLVLTGTLHSDTTIAREHARHGDGVKVIALSVPDVDRAYKEATTRGARGVTAPHTIADGAGRGPDRRDRHLRRHAAPVRRSLGVPGAVPPRL